MLAESTFKVPPRLSREMVDSFWASEPDPDCMADIFFRIGHAPFDANHFLRVEFELFRGHMCSAVFLVRTVEKAAGPAVDDYMAYTLEVEQAAPEWKGELEMMRDDARGAIEDAQMIAWGAACLTATAALETLVGEVLPTHHGTSGSGLQQRFARLLAWIAPIKRHVQPSPTAPMSSGTDATTTATP